MLQLLFQVRSIPAFRMALGGLGLLVAATALPSCASFRPQYHSSVRDWPHLRPPPEDSVAHRLFLLGDSGSGPARDSFPVFDMLEPHLSEAGGESSLLLLGDMVPGPTGDSMQALNRLLPILRGFAGRILVLHGERDWAWRGVDGLEDIQAHIRRQLPGRSITFTSPGCGDPVEVELTRDLSILLLDSPWWIMDWRGHYRINQDCRLKSRKALALELSEILKGSRNKNLVLAMHHPLQSGGPYGGSFTWKEHLFPLTALNEKLWIPLPMVGSLYPFYRSTIGGPQDLAYYRYQEWYQMLIQLAQENGSFLFAAAHEHGLQYFETKQQYFINSGSATERSPMHRDKGARFLYGQRGFAELLFMQDGAVWLQFWVPGPDAPRGRIAFRQKVKGALPHLAPTPETEYLLYRLGLDSLSRPVSTFPYEHSRLGTWLWGKNYRELYQRPFQFPLLDLRQFQGGLTPLRRGGGTTTNTLSLQAKDGRPYLMRSVKKDPSRALPFPFNRTFALEVVEDQFSGIHPFAALPLPALSRAAGLFHTNPGIYFVPRQPGLEPYSREMGRQVYLLEERPNNDWAQAPHFGFASRVVSTETLYQRLTSGKSVLLDEKALARARLFDLLIGDWDRGEDQWRWAELDIDSAIVYKPIPKDRDQAFSLFEGFNMALIRFLVGQAKQFGKYGPELSYHIRWAAYQALEFDRALLTGLDWEDWEEQALILQHRLTDSVIEQAFRSAWSPQVRTYSRGAAESLKKRRDRSLSIARRFYEHVSRRVDIKGSRQKDRFEVHREADGSTRVRLWQLDEEGKKGRLRFDRTFHRRETYELRLYGLAGDDAFYLSGKAKKRTSKVRLIGDLGRDTLVDRSTARSWTKKNVYHDFQGEPAILRPGPESKIILTNDPEKIVYDPRGHDYAYRRLLLLPDGGFNPDDGLFVGGSAELKTYGFKKEPFATRQRLQFRYAIGTNGLLATYRATITDLLGRWELFFDSFFSNFLYTNNFYGFGNDTSNPEAELGLEYNRVRMQRIQLFPALMNQRNANRLVAFGPWLEFVRVAPTGDRFIDEVADDLGIDPFGSKAFLSPRVLVEFDNYDDDVLRTQGIGLFLDAGWRFRLDQADENYPYVNAHLSFYYPLDPARRFVFGTRIGGMHLFAEPGEFEFYHAATLGGLGPNVNLRGFRRDRFSGRSAFFHNLSLEYELLRWNNRTFPLSGGVTLGLDYGRVWMPGTPAGHWHVGYGAGLFLNPLDLLSLRAGVFRGDRETTTVAGAVGFFF